MRFLNIAAAPHPSGNRIDLSWVHPNPTQFPGVRMVRREGTHPLSPTPTLPQQGVIVADTNPTSPQSRIQVNADGSYTVTDTDLKGETVYYYALFPYAGTPPNYDIDRHNRVAAMATAPYNIAGQMADLLPTLYHRYDTVLTNADTVAPADRQNGQLRRFLDLPGSQLDLLYSFARAMRDLHDLEKVDSRLLVLLAQWIGWQIDQRIEPDTQRNNIRNAPHLYKSIGLIPTVEATVKRLVGWESRSKEFVHNVFRSNQPERLNLWMREQNAAGVWSTPTTPLSLDFAYEGRPSAVRDQDGILWLCYHTLRKGHWDIWYKTFREGQGWTPSEPLTNRAQIDMYPTAALQGTTLRVFWSTYTEADQRWQINFRTRTNGQWSAITPLSALAPFATDRISRRQPWAVTDNAGLLWLFWLELAGGQWQLRYNSYDGTKWTLPASATFPLDAGADPRVEGPPFVVFHPTDTEQPLWVFWARTELVDSSGQQRWRIVYRIKASLNPSAADWSVIRALPSGPAESQDREPAALVNANGDVELFWSSTRNGGWSIWRATVNRTTQDWGTAEMVITSPYTQCDPLPIPLATGTMLVSHANESVAYTSTVYGATETVDHRYGGSTTVDVRNTTKRALWGKFGDFQTFTSDVGQNGERANADRYARDTVGLYVTPDTTDPAVIQRDQNLLRNALREFLPASVRSVFITEADGDNMSHIIQDEGRTMPARSGLNFIGAGVTANDEAEQNRTTIMIRGTDIVNVKDFGARGDGIINDADAIIAAMAAGVATNTTVYFPAGDYFTGSTVLTTPSTVNGSLRISGAGKGVTRITRTDGVATTTFQIQLTGPTANVWIADLSIIGPMGLGFANGSTGILWVAGGIVQQFRIERVEVTGTHDGAIQGSGGGTIEVIDCDLAGTVGVVGCFEPKNTPNSAFFYARGGTWQTPNGDLSAQGSVGLSIHPHIPYLVAEVTFQNLGRYGIYQNGSPTAARKPAVAVGCRFIDAEMAKTQRNGLSVFTGCAVAGSSSGLGSALGGQVLVAGCSFERTLLDTGASADANVTITNSRFTDAQVIITGPDRNLQIRGTTFVITDAYTLGGHILQLSSGTIDLDDVLFHDQTTTTPYASCLGITTTATTTTTIVRSNRLRSLGTIRASLGFIYSDGATSVTLDNSDIAGDINLGLGTSENAWGGSNNLFHSGAITGAVTLQQRFVRRVGVNPQPIPSAPILDVGTAAFLTYDTHVIVGAAAIKLLGNAFPCVGILRLIVGPGGAWSTAGDGLIVPRTTDARTPGAVVTLLWEPITGKWLEV